MTIIIDIIFILVILCIILANVIVSIIYKDLKEVENQTKLSGFEIAHTISNSISKKEPHIIKKKGRFLDHYNMDRNVIKLSPEVFDGTDIYAGLVALGIAVDLEDKKKSTFNKLSSFLVMASYVIIVLGAMLNSSNNIYFGLIIFIVAFIVELITLNNHTLDYDKFESILKEASKKELIKNLKEYKNELIVLHIRHLATLPYNFIIFFR